jgi:hypothetical protein
VASATPRAFSSPVNQKWSTKAEYLYADFGTRTIFNDNVGRIIFPENLRHTASILRVGVNYRFVY